MKPRTFSPRKLDMAAFIESGETLSGELPVPELVRLARGLSEEVPLASLPPVTWSAVGRVVPQRVGGPALWLDLSASAELAWECQRCLHAVRQTVALQRSIRFVRDETAAEALDADSEDDVLALSRQFDLLELIEDELIMAEPIVPRHDQCPTDMTELMHDDTEVAPSGEVNDEAAAEPEKKNPFAVLASLKKTPG
jgi:uncharacterized protein